MSLVNCYSNLICGDYCTFSIDSNGNVYSFGKNESGKLGQINEEEVYLPSKIPNLKNIKLLSCGTFHTLCCDYNGDLYSFGNNSYGQLGIGNGNPYTKYPQKIINIPPIKYICCGYYFSICVTIDNGNLYSFGKNDYGQLGIKNKTNQSSPQLIPNLTNVNLIDCGYHVICKTYNNEFYSWGRGDSGELGNNNDKTLTSPSQCYNWPDNIISIKCGLYHSLLLSDMGEVYSFGSNIFGKLGINDDTIKAIHFPKLLKNIPEILRIECGHQHSMFIDVSYNFWVFGGNKSGQLGVGDTNYRCSPYKHNNLGKVKDISTGGYHTIVKLINNQIFAFGDNEYSHLLPTQTNNKQLIPMHILENKEDIWFTNNGNSRQKSARK